MGVGPGVLTLALSVLLAAEPAAAAAAPPPDVCGTVRLLVDGRLTPAEAIAALLPVRRDAAPALIEAVAESDHPQAYIDLFEALAELGGHDHEPAVRPHVFSPDPEVAVAATRALGGLGGPRAVPTLEHVVRANRSFGQTLAAIEMLQDIGLPSSFGALAKEAENAGSHPILRSLAVRALPAIDLLRARKWVKGLKLSQSADAFFVAEVDRLALLLGEQGRGGNLR